MKEDKWRERKERVEDKKEVAADINRCTVLPPIGNFLSLSVAQLVQTL